VNFCCTFHRESNIDKILETPGIGTAKESDKPKYDLYLVDDSFDNFIVEVTNHEMLLVYHYTEDLKNTNRCNS